MDNNLPIYLKIAQLLEDEILNDRLKADDRIPSTNDFSRMMQVNPATAGKGLNELLNRDILYKKRGLGMFVTAEAKQIIIEERRQAFSKEMLPEFLREASQLQLSLEELIRMIEEEYHA